MDNLIFPAVMMGACLILGGGYAVFARVKKSKTKETGDAAKVTANEFVNVRDVLGNVLYTNDGPMMCYISVAPLSTQLLSRSEQRTLMRALTGEMSGFPLPWKMIAASRPVDISPVIMEQQSLLSETDDGYQRDILRKEIAEMSRYAVSGEIVERQFFFEIWNNKENDDAEEELLRDAQRLLRCFTDCGLSASLLDRRGIVRLCNLLHNPEYIHLEDADFVPAMPFIAGAAADSA